MTRKTFKIPNISCNHCVMTIKRELEELEGVTQVTGNAETKEVSAEWEAPATWDSITSLLAEINYPVE